MFMRLLKQQLHAWPEEELIQESEQFLDYYMPDTKSEQMDIIQTFISDIPHPVLIVDSITEEIQYFNPAADLDVPMFGKPIGDIVQLFGKEVAQEPVAYFNGKWYSVFKTPFLWENKRHTKFELKPRTIIPDRQSLNGWKSMISVMLHRFRSPLTGVEGFLHLLEDMLLFAPLPHSSTQWLDVLFSLSRIYFLLNFFIPNISIVSNFIPKLNNIWNN